MATLRIRKSSYSPKDCLGNPTISRSKGETETEEWKRVGYPKECRLDVFVRRHARNSINGLFLLAIILLTTMRRLLHDGAKGVSPFSVWPELVSRYFL
jgi:hypothetical protein